MHNKTLAALVVTRQIMPFLKFMMVTPLSKEKMILKPKMNLNNYGGKI